MRKRLIGTVKGDKMNKSRRVEVERVFRHPKYGKTIRERIVCHTHDEENASHTGDLVEIIESRPLSKLKRWALVRIVRASTVRAVETPAGA
jgi:small subunit ribosomal protein S17